MSAGASYADFIAEKVNFRNDQGHEVDDSDIHPFLFPHQRAIVRWAVAGGRRAIFAAFGLGKSIMQLETIRLTLAKSGGRGLIICPLGVRGEFARDAALIGLTTRFVRRTEEMASGEEPDIWLTNYESVRDGRLDVDAFTAVSLDEASVLRSFGSKTFITFLELFDAVPFKFVATATPSPNRHKELIHYAGFLGVLDTGQALTRFFQRDSTKANNLTLHPHKEREFWLWLSSWAVFVQRPSDLGFSDEGYDLPEMAITHHEVAVDHMAVSQSDTNGQGRLYRGGELSAVQASREKRLTLPERLERMMEIVRAANVSEADQVVIWCDLNDEQSAIEAALKAEGITHSSVFGALDTDEAERRLTAWRNRETAALIGKPVMLGQGVNLQQCNKAIFVGITYKFNDLIQACHRIHRFGQTRACEVHIIHAESEREILASLRIKWDQHRELVATMSAIIQEYGLGRIDISEALKRSIGVNRIEASGVGYLVANNDCVLETKGMEDNSVDEIITSVPFANHYEYTPAYEDFGHTDNNDHFWAQMDHLTPELLRILRPGRMYCCHVKDRILFGSVTGAGAPTVSPFHAEALMHGIKHGFDYAGMITVVTDVVRENNQTYRLSYGEMTKDGTKMGVGSPEYILLFRKPQTDRSKGYADVPVKKSKDEYTLAKWQVDAHAFWRSSGNRMVTPDELAGLSADQVMNLFTESTMKHIYDFESHIAIGERLLGKGSLPKTFMLLAPGSHHPDVWHDINRMLTLNGEQTKKRKENHICPLQIEIVDRLIERYSNPGDLIFDPFGGLFTVPVRALKLGRQGRAVELNPQYFLDGLAYVEAMAAKVDMPTLFDLDSAGAA